MRGPRERRRRAPADRLYTYIYIYICIYREREGPRLSVTTVRKCAALTGSRLPNQAPAALHPSRQARGGTCRPPPLGMGPKKSGMKFTRGGVSSSSLKAPAMGLVPASREWDGALFPWGCRLLRPQSGQMCVTTSGPPWPTAWPRGVGYGTPRGPGRRQPGGGSVELPGATGRRPEPGCGPVPQPDSGRQFPAD